MSPCQRLLWTGLTCLIATVAAAEDTAVKLPPEGAWARYHGVTKPDDGVETSYKLLIKVLGREEWNGRTCRWIEIEEWLPDDPKKRQASQYLIPEQALLESERPLDEAVRAISRNDEGKIVSESLEFIGFGGTDMLFLPGCRKNAKVVNETEMVDYQSGKLTIPQGQRGEYTWTRKSSSMTWDYSVWIDPKVTIGLARKKMKLTRKIDGNTVRTWTMNQWVEDFGLDAKSAFSE